MSKRYGPTPEVERVPAGGGYDEWFDLRAVATIGDSVDLSDLTDHKERVAFMLKKVIVDWSLEDGAGNKLPITIENIIGLDTALATPLIERLGTITTAFLARNSRRTSV